jgi:multiple sugar transport system permease protein
MTQGNYKLVKTLLLLFLGIWLIFTLFPLYFMIVTSLKPVEEINRMIPTFWPQTMKFNNYAGIFADPGSLKSLVDSVIVSVTNTALFAVPGHFGRLCAGALRGGSREPGGLDPAEPHVPAVQ